MPDSAEDIRFMRQALDLARRGWGTTHPNPMVGAVLVENGQVIAEGWHEKAGGPHAEIVALRAAEGRDLSRSTLYVTLEPCSTVGRTGACSDAIRKAGIPRVVVGAMDPNPDHAGRGIEILRQAGVDVSCGLLENECNDLNLIFSHWIVHHTPFIAGKIATTIDGKIATRTGHSKWVTGPLARLDVMRWRRYFPAIAVAAGTVLADNPRLTSRLDDTEWCPLRLIFDRRLRTLKDLLPAVYTDEFRHRTVLITSPEAAEIAADELRTLTDTGVRCWEIGGSVEALFSQFRQRCVNEGITGVFVEGGAHLLSEALNSLNLDYLFAYRSPKILADADGLSVFHGAQVHTMMESMSLLNVQHGVFGEDQLMRGHILKLL